MNAVAYVECKNGQQNVVFNRANKKVDDYLDKIKPLGFDDCYKVHEQHHIDQAAFVCPGLCKGKDSNDDECHVFAAEVKCTRQFECFGHYAQLECVIEKTLKFNQDGNAAGLTRGLEEIRKQLVAFQGYRCPRPTKKEVKNIDELPKLVGITTP